MSRMHNERIGGVPTGDGPSGPKPIRSCPICGKPAQPDARPFCSKRCADVDLHRWLGGSYAIPVAEGAGAIEDADDTS